MAIYKPRRSRWPLLIGLAIAGFVLGLIVGVLAVGNRPPDLVAAAESIADGMADSAGLLEVVEIEYSEAIGPGGSDAEFQGALDNLARSRERYAAVSGALAEIDAARATRIDQGFASLQASLEQRAPIVEVQQAIAALRDELLGT